MNQKWDLLKSHDQEEKCYLWLAGILSVVRESAVSLLVSGLLLVTSQPSVCQHTENFVPSELNLGSPLGYAHYLVIHFS